MEISNNARAVPAVKRDCYFPDEYKLEMYQVSQYSSLIGQLYRYSSLIGQLYSQSGCIFECKMRIGKAKTMGGCTPWFYPSKGDMQLLTPLSQPNGGYSADTNMCDPWQTQIFLSAVMDGGAGGVLIQYLHVIYAMSTCNIYISRQGVQSLSPGLRHHYLQPVCERHAPAEVGVALCM